jgi:capsular polysaccharide transport system permease protein
VLKFLLKHTLFYLCVALPTLVAIIYYGLFASAVYISESQFIVRTAQKQSSSALGDLLKGSSFMRAQDDTYSVQSYILSRDAMRIIDEELDLKDKFSSTEINALSRFAGIVPDDSYEAFHQYYLKMIHLGVDPASSIITLQTKAFTAEDSLGVNQKLLSLSEQLINKLNERARQDMVRFAQREVEESEEKAKTASLNLAEYQNRVGVIDPVQQSSLPLQQVAKLQNELIAVRSQILQIEALAPENPQLPVLRKHITMLEKEIDKESGKVTGQSDKSMATKAVQFHRLSLDKEFAERQLASTLASLEQARAEAQRQQLYLEHIAQPSLPDEAMEPRRLRAVLTIFILGLISWGILGLLVAGTKEHHG